MAIKRWPVWVWFAVGNVVVLAAIAAVTSWVYLHGNPFARKLPAEIPEVANLPPMTPPPGTMVGAKRLAVDEVIAQVDGGIVMLNCKNASGKKIGLGSGFIINDQGLIATNYHVLRGASQAEAVFSDGKAFEVKGCRAWDVGADLAILELESKPENFEVLKLCSDTNRPAAAEVIAIGHPQGFRFSTTTGIISGVHTTANLPEPYRSVIRAPAGQVWIQTSAAISGGNSGGPLLSRTGEVLGINTWVAGGQNLGFAADVRHLAALAEKVNLEVLALADLTGPEEKLTTLLEGFHNQRLYLTQELEEAQDDAARKKLLEARHPAIDYLPKFFELADQYRGKPVAFSALRACCDVVALGECPQSCNASVKQAVDRLVEDHRNDPRLASMLLRLGRSSSPVVQKLGERLGNESQQRTVQAAGWLLLALSLRTESADAKQPDNGPIIEALEKLEKDFADVEFEGALIGEIVEPLLYELKHLAVGCVPPDIDGSDQDGKSMRLSEHRGKVVVLDFWADWCPHCVNMYPLERRLVKQYANQPFALLGVNCDEPARFRRVLAQKAVTWQNWHDGPAGPIGQSWRIQSFPTLYVLDHEGKIRYVNVRGEELERAVKELVAKAPGASLEQAKEADEARSAQRVAEAPVLSADLPAAEPELRTWTSRDGRTARFRFLGVDGERVKLRRENGKELTAPLSAFSDEDQAWVKDQPDDNVSPTAPAEESAKSVERQ